MELLIWFGIAFIVFLIAREFMCWYWKINRALHLLESIDSSLKKISQHMENSRGDAGRAVERYTGLSDLERGL